jgi:pimeloyl-ACP methyl ester carboxylesterase
MNPNISAAWHGVLDTGSAKVALAFELVPVADGGTALLRTRSYGDLKLPLTRRDGRIKFEAAIVDIALDVQADEAGQRLAGVCQHAGAAFPVAFALGRSSTPTRTARPQTPKAPFDYATETVSFAAEDGSWLVGTLTRPTDRPVRGALLLSSWFGRTDRDQRTFGHRPLAIWADAFTRLGFATLRYDKRGAGESGGDFHRATTADFATDLARAVAFVRAQPGIDPRRLGLFGHSEGGHISADVAAADAAIALCVMLTPTGVPEEDIFKTELFRAAIAVGGTPLDPEARINLALELAEAGRIAASGEEAAARTQAILQREVAAGRFPAERVRERARTAAAPWRRHWRNYDYTASLRRLACPTLVVFAERDLQTPPSYHAPKVRAALAGNPLSAIVELPGLNHFLQRARTGAPSEYGDIEETVAPEAVSTVCDWLQSTTADW